MCWCQFVIISDSRERKREEERDHPGSSAAKFYGQLLEPHKIPTNVEGKIEKHQRERGERA